MGLAEQMEAIDRLMRRPQDLDELLAGSAEDAAVLGTVDRPRLQATHGAFAELVVARWWRPKFPAVIATLEHFLGADQAASYLVGHPAFLTAEEEDLRGSALGGAILAGVSGSKLAKLPAWLPELLAYEYLLALGLPRRARGEEVDAELEARLIPDAAWLSGGRLSREVLLAGFSWPVDALQEEPHETEPDPHARLLYVEGQAVLDTSAPDVAGDVLELLAAGGDDATIAALGAEALEALAWLWGAGLVTS